MRSVGWSGGSATHLLAGDVSGQPVKALVEAVARGGACALYVPARSAAPLSVLIRIIADPDIRPHASADNSADNKQ